MPAYLSSSNCPSLWQSSLQNGLINSLQDIISYYDSLALTSPPSSSSALQILSRA